MSGDSDAIRDELGDLLLQVVFHAEIASEDGRWDVDDVARRLTEKLVHRHPHVFGEVEVSGAEEVLTNWEKLKAEEGSGPRPAWRRGSRPRCPRSPGRPRCSVERPGGGSSGGARRLRWRRSARRSGELSRASDDAEREIGEVLFAAVAAARKLGVDAESALRRTTRGFAERYERLWRSREERGLDLELVSERRGPRRVPRSPRP